jgi:para-nitrobenzyl esterase
MSLPGAAPVVTLSNPVLDGSIISEVPIKAIKNGTASGIPVLIGTTLEEFRLFGNLSPDFLKMSEAEMVKGCQSFLPVESVPGIIETYRSARARRSDDTSPAGLFAAIQTDFLFRLPAIHFIEAQNRYSPVYNYLFTWKSPVKGRILGACHALDIGFIFGTYNDSFWGSGPLADRLSADMQDAWLAFARTGNPGCERLGKWPEYGSRRMTMLLGEICHLEEASLDEERCAWEPLSEMFEE